MVHKGEIIEKYVRESGIAIAELARRMSISRMTVYNMFTQPDVPVDTIFLIGEIIHFDFTTKIPSLRKYKSSVIDEADVIYHQPVEVIRKLKEEVDVWKNKYILLLEEHQKLLKKRGGKE